MLKTFANAWKIADLRKKILYTLFIVLIFRIGSAIPVPFLDPSKIKEMIEAGGSLLGFIDVMSGGAFAKSTLFALNISPYITSSIVIQLLAVAIPYLENLAKEGPEGRKKLNQITRYTTVALAVLESFGYYALLRNQGAVNYTSGFEGIFAQAVIISSFIGGAMFVVWLGEQIDQKGIGNGISMILFAGIVSRVPSVVMSMFGYLKLAFAGGTNSIYFLTVPVIGVLFVIVIGFIVVMTNAERRIPVMYAKRVVGRKMYGGQSTFIPIKVNMSGVMPVIFASSLLAIPGTINGFINISGNGFWQRVLTLFNYNSPTYAVIYLLLILAFNYFYVSIQYNPIEIANNLKSNSGTIPGLRPGKPTSEFIAKIVGKITFIGGIFLGIIAILPIAVAAITKINVALGGTTVIILVGVALDTVRQLESQMMMRHYKGFLE
ncbi:MAG: preprotein translocase subunit SecY [Oscillospiraceae bacterium]